MRHRTLTLFWRAVTAIATILVVVVLVLKVNRNSSQAAQSSWFSINFHRQAENSRPTVEFMRDLTAIDVVSIAHNQDEPLQHTAAAARGKLCLATSAAFDKYSESRSQEIQQAIVHNAEQSVVAELLLFASLGDKGLPAVRPHVTVIPSPEQPTYRSLLIRLNESLAGFGAVYNADIELSAAAASCLGQVFGDASTLPRNKVFALTRQPHPSCPTQSGGGANPSLPSNLCTERQRHNSAWVMSADMFLFRLPLLPFSDEILSRLDHIQNIRGAENHVMYWLRKAGYTIENPCSKIPIYHRHCQPERAQVAGMGAGRKDREFRAENPRTNISVCLSRP